MAEVIDSLLVRLGLEADEKEFREASALFDGVRTKALQFGAVIGAGLGLQNLTFGFASAKDELGKFAEMYGTTAQFVDSLGYALDQSGGSARDAFGSIKRIRDLLEDTEWGEVAEGAFRVVGFDPYLLQGVTDITEAYERLSGAVQGLSQEDARRALGSLGFSDAEIRLFRSGPESLRQTLAEAESYARVTKEMTDQAERFQASLINLTKAAEGLGNELSTLILDDFSDSMQGAADFLRDNRSEMADFFKQALPWLEATAVGVGTLVALQGGMKALSMLGPVARVAGPAAAAALTYQFAKENPSHLQHSKDALLAEPGTRKLFRAAGDMTGIGWMKEWGAEPENGYDLSDTSLPHPSYIDRMLGIGAPDAPGPVPSSATSNTTYEIHIDARGATNPAEVEAAARRGAEAVMREGAAHAADDLRTVVK